MSAEQSGAERAAQNILEAEHLLDQRQPAAAESLLREALALEPDSAAALSKLGRALNNLGRLEDAEAALRRSVELEPQRAEAWFSLGHVLRALGRLPDATGAAERAVSLGLGGDSRAVRLLASIRMMSGDPDAAADLLQSARASHPDDVALAVDLADALRATDRFDEAAAAYHDALLRDPGNPDALAGLGTVHHARLELDEAATSFRQALARVPKHPVAETGLAWVLELIGDYQAALDHVEPCLGDPEPGWAISAAARLLRRLGRSAEARQLLESADLQRMTPADRTSALTTLGQVREDAGDYDAAFRAFTSANQCLPSRFDPAGFVRSVDRIIDFFSADRWPTLLRSGCDSEQPVFIVGMPRSGTSMIEQILGRHGAVVPCGERREIFRLPRELSGGNAEARWPEVLSGISAAKLAELATSYLDTAELAGQECLRFTDKLPANFLNLGLIQMLFPRSRVIYCHRDPMDSGLSCFQQNFRSEGMDFARNMAHIGLQQQACWRLMEHWMATLGLPILRVDYEATVADPENGARKLVEFLGLEWDPACLDFHLSDRIVRTASYEQVRKPVYTSSVGRWRNYEAWLGTLRSALDAPWISRANP